MPLSDSSQRGARAGTIAASLLLPPLGIYRQRGAPIDFIIACGLTVAGFIPGVIFALVRLATSKA